VRADRLVAILLMLQQRGRVTAREVAEELEVSERTARRDLDALGIAGLPVYSVQGRNGGWELLGGGSTDLTGLNAAEVHALFMVAGSAPNGVGGLGAASPQVKTALRKLVRALPESFRTQAESASAAVVVDPEGWGQRTPDRPPPPHLETVQRAVIAGEQLTLGYVARDRAPSTRIVHPLGLATKRSVWYLVADTDAGLRTFRVERITSAVPTGEPVVRPPDFDLPEAWRLITEEVDERLWPVRVRAFVVPHAIPWCRGIFGTRVHIGPSGADGRVEVELRGHHVEPLAAEIAGFGNLLEVVDPPELRRRLAAIAGELQTLYVD
jgi:predicted DNA-binding transcriptional regulator YafY